MNMKDMQECCAQMCQTEDMQAMMKDMAEGKMPACCAGMDMDACMKMMREAVEN